MMIYKSILLSALLVQFALYNNNNIDTELKQLRDDLFKKELELSALGKEIEDKEKLIEEIIKLMINVLKSFTEQEKKEFIAFGKRFDEAFLVPNFKNFLMHELFENMENRDQIERVKSLLIRTVMEKKY